MIFSQPTPTTGSAAPRNLFASRVAPTDPQISTPTPAKQIVQNVDAQVEIAGKPDKNFFERNKEAIMVGLVVSGIVWIIARVAK